MFKRKRSASARLLRFNTGNTRLGILMLGFGAYLAMPIAAGLWTYREVFAGHFPVSAEALSMPFLGFVIIWIAAFPFVVFAGATMEIIGRKLSGVRVTRDV